MDETYGENNLPEYWKFCANDVNIDSQKICVSGCIVFSSYVHNIFLVSNIDHCIYPDKTKTIWCDGFTDYLTNKKYHNKQFLNLIRFLRSYKPRRDGEECKMNSI